MADRPALENGVVKITPAMIEAGVYELALFDPVEDSWPTRAEIVKEIYSTMARLSPSNNASTTGSSSPLDSAHVEVFPILSNKPVNQPAERT